MSEPTRFYIQNDKLIQSKKIRTYRYLFSTPYGTKRADYEMPYEAIFSTKLKIVGSETNYNGSTYFEWITGAGVTMYSSVKDFTEIVTTLKPDAFGYYEGLFTFTTRGGRNRSLQLVRNKITPEPNITDVKRPAITTDTIISKHFGNYIRTK